MKHKRYTLQAKTKTKRIKISLRSFFAFVALTVLSISASAFHLTANNVAANGTAGTISIVSPQADATIPGPLTLTAHLNNTSQSAYDMFWYVDNGTWNWMGNSADGQNKQADLNVSGWTWHAPSTSYTITLVAVMHANGQRIYSGVPINVGAASTATLAPTTPTASPTPSTTTSTPAPIAAASTTALYVNPDSEAAQTAANTTDPTMKRVMTKLAAVPTASWFGDWNTNVQADVNNVVSAAAAAHQLPTLVAYDIPLRDCSGYSGGGASSPSAYQSWIKSFAAGIGNRSALVVLEPDALAQISCLSSGDQATRYQLLNFAVSTLKANAGTKVYLDAGNPSWVGVNDMAGRLKAAGVASADGFSLNVSNFIATSDNLNYGNQLSAATAGKHFVVDTSRNGNGSNGQWCNPSGRAVGTPSTSSTGDSLADYFLWVKTPGESDGTCNGGPAAGTWWPAYAETLGLNAGW